MGTLKRRIGMFLLGSATAMCALPLVNAVRHGGRVDAFSTLYDTTFVWSKVSAPLRKIGISTRPNQVVVGRSGWLFAGDQYAQSISAKRRTANADDVAAAGRRAKAATAWSAWLAAQGVTDWRILVCPDKDSIYPELLPAWYVLASSAPIDLAMRLADPRHVIDARPAMRRARADETIPLYLRTDTHWTVRGAYVAYGALARSHVDSNDRIVWLAASQVQFAQAKAQSGDLARLLQAADPNGDASASALLDDEMIRDRIVTDAYSGSLLDPSLGSRVEAPTRPTLTRSPNALNQRRLLWLRDSFGTAMRPFLLATFSEVIELDRDTTTPARIEELVRQFKPGSLLVSVVERNARSEWFERMPPTSEGRSGLLPNE